MLYKALADTVHVCSKFPMKLFASNTRNCLQRQLNLACTKLIQGLPVLGPRH